MERQEWAFGRLKKWEDELVYRKKQVEIAEDKIKEWEDYIKKIEKR